MVKQSAECFSFNLDFLAETKPSSPFITDMGAFFSDGSEEGYISTGVLGIIVPVVDYFP